MGRDRIVRRVRASHSRCRSTPLVHSSFAKQSKQLGINFFCADAIVQNPEGAIDGDRTFVGAIGSRESVENIADRHHFSWQRNLIALQLVGIARPIELFVMRPGDFRNIFQIARPRNLAQKIICVHHVRLDFEPLGGIQSCPWEWKAVLPLQVSDTAIRLPDDREKLLRYFHEPARMRLFEQRWLVRFR